MSNGHVRSPERDRAQADSRGCRYCSGEGMVIVFHPQYTGSPVIEFKCHDRGWVRTAGRVAAHCVCKMGRWMRERTDEEMLRCIPDYQKCLDGESFWLPDDPTDTEDMIRDRERDRGGSAAEMAQRLGRQMAVSRRRSTP